MLCRRPNRESCAVANGKVIASFDAEAVTRGSTGTLKIEIVWNEARQSAYLIEHKGVCLTDCYKIDLVEAVIISASLLVNEAEYETGELPAVGEALRKAVALLSAATGARQSILFGNALRVAHKYKVRDFRDIYFSLARTNNISLEYLPVTNTAKQLIVDTLSVIKLLSQKKISDMVCSWLSATNLSSSDELALKKMLRNIAKPDFLYPAYLEQVTKTIQRYRTKATENFALIQQ